MTEGEFVRSSRETAFSLYLRTGRRIGPDAIEMKFNPWHDEENGRFTFRGRGRYFGATVSNGNAPSAQPGGTGVARPTPTAARESGALIAIAFAPIIPPIMRCMWSNRATRLPVSPPSARD